MTKNHEPSLSIDSGDLIYEEDLLRNPFNLSGWLRYISYRKNELDSEKTKNQLLYDKKLKDLFILYERATQQLPGSYKLWKQYLDLRARWVLHLNPIKDSNHYAKMNDCYLRSLLLLNKMPRIWLDYLTFLLCQFDLTLIRHTFDRALGSLPLTQHIRIWKPMALFAQKVGGETANTLYKRLIKLDKSRIEEYVNILIQLEKYDEAAIQMTILLDEDIPLKNKTQYQLWLELSDLITKTPKYIQSIDVNKILRSGISRFSDQVGNLWCSLAQYFVLLSQFDKARSIYEEAISHVTTVRDFVLIFDTYAELEESLLSKDMERLSLDKSMNKLELDLKLTRFEDLMIRRPFLINDVLLRQNSSDVLEWLKRVALYSEDEEKMVETFTKAVATVNPKKTTLNQLPLLWIEFAKFYEERDDLESARKIFLKATQVPFKNIVELVEIWIQYADMEIRNDNFSKAIEVYSNAVEPIFKSKDINYHDDNIPVQHRIYKSIKLWSKYIDLEESIGTVESTKLVYNRILELKIATPQIIINYATFLEDNGYFEDSFKVYERGVELFKYPIAFEIWNIYLTKFIDRYGGTKLERARDLFEQALEHCPPKYSKPIFLLYGKLEEEYGLARHAMKIYDRGTRSVSTEDCFEMFQYYIAKASTCLGVTSTRDIYEKAIQILPNNFAKEMCLNYANMERKLGEIDRARAIYAYCSQFCDPRAVPKFWTIWHDFEVDHGNEDTFKEMLRIKRSVQALCNTELSYITAKMANSNGQSSANISGFVKGSQSIKGTLGDSPKEDTNPDEIKV